MPIHPCARTAMPDLMRAKEPEPLLLLLAEDQLLRVI